MGGGWTPALVILGIVRIGDYIAAWREWRKKEIKKERRVNRPSFLFLFDDWLLSKPVLT